MDLSYIIKTYGYIAVYIGTFIEGEVILLLSSMLSSDGYLNLKLVMLFGFLGGISGDWFFYFLAKTKGKKILEKSSIFRKRYELIEPIVKKFMVVILIFSRFFIGFRIIIPFICGLTSMSKVVFFSLNIISALAWTYTVSYLGYHFGKAIFSYLNYVRDIVIAIILLIITAIVAFSFYNYRKNLKNIEDDGEE